MSRNRRTETYNFNDPRNIAAFEQLLAEEEDDDDSQKRRRGSSAAGGTRAKPKRDKEKFFLLREDAQGRFARSFGPAEPSSVLQSRSAALPELRAMFRGLVDPCVVEDVLASCGGDKEAACSALLEMSGQAEAHPASAAVGEQRSRPPPRL